MRLGFRSRLLLWHTVATVVILALVAVVAEWTLARMTLRQLDSALLTLAETEAASALDGPTEVHIHDLPSVPEMGESRLSRLDKLVQVIDRDGTVLARSLTLGDASLPAPAAVLSRTARGESVIETVVLGNGEQIRLVSLPIGVGDSYRYVMQVGASLRPVAGFQATARWIGLALAATILAAVMVIGALLARSALRPIDRVVATAKSIGAGSSGQRLPHPGTDDELGRLVSTLNEMLGRMDRSVEALRRFTADAAHELRTPLSRICSELEIALRRPREAEEYVEALRSSLEEAERLSRLVVGLLTLARLDAEGNPGADAERSDVPAVVAEERDRLGAVARPRGVDIALSPSPPLAARISPPLLSLLVGNLLENAVRFSPAGSQVQVRVRGEGAEVVVEVTDVGPGVPAQELDRIFDRFYRGASSRSSEGDGYGLGLSICRAIAEGHGGSIHARSGERDGATTFTARLPSAPLADGAG